MHRVLFFVACVIQASPIPSEPAIVDLLTKGGIAALVLWLWLDDRKSREVQQRMTDERYSKLVNDMLEVIRTNTAANAGLKDALENKVIDCPMQSHVKHGAD